MSDPRDSLPPPETTYRERLVAREDAASIWRWRANALGIARLAVFAGAGLALWIAWRAGGRWPWGVLVPLAIAFAVLAVVQDLMLRRRDAARRAAALYREGLERIAGRPPVRPGDRFVDPSHPYSADLDLFGPASLFERIDTCRTYPGEQALAAWLAGAAPRPPAAAEILSRQEAVREIIADLDLRETLGEAGRGARELPEEHRRLLEWAVAPAALSRAGLLRALSWGMPAVLLALCVVSLAGGPSWPAWTWVAATLFASAWTRPASTRVTSGIEVPARVLGNYERMVAVAEAASFRAEALQAIRRSLVAEGPAASRELRRLRHVVAWTDAMRNQIAAFLGLFLLWEVHCALALEAWRRRCGGRLAGWLDALGRLEAISSLATYAYERRDHVFPEIAVDGAPALHAEELGHPLLDPAVCVRNDVVLESAGTLLLVSGSNMSGKSTMLRAVGINAAMALAGSVVCAGRLRVTPMAIATSMRVLDSLQQGTSHFLAELKRLKLVTDLADGGGALLFLLDEILHGTNSRERLLGVRGLVAHLLGRKTMGMITTHDLDMADLEKAHPGRVRNVHFADHLEDGSMRFDYKMHPGVASTTNALRLMRQVGIPLANDPGRPEPR